MSSHIRASVIAQRRLQARGLSNRQILDAMAGYSLGCILLYTDTVAAGYRS